MCTRGGKPKREDSGWSKKTRRKISKVNFLVSFQDFWSTVYIASNNLGTASQKYLPIGHRIYIVFCKKCIVIMFYVYDQAVQPGKSTHKPEPEGGCGFPVCRALQVMLRTGRPELWGWSGVSLSSGAVPLRASRWCPEPIGPTGLDLPAEFVRQGSHWAQKPRAGSGWGVWRAHTQLCPSGFLTGGFITHWVYQSLTAPKDHLGRVILQTLH